jgi:transcriptional regulator with XRE-family HTH domain
MQDQKIIEARKLLLSHLWNVAQENGMTQLEISERTGFSPNSISRMLSGKFPPTLDSLLKLCEAIGVYIFLESKSSKSKNATMMRNRHKRKGDEN